MEAVIRDFMVENF